MSATELKRVALYGFAFRIPTEDAKNFERARQTAHDRAAKQSGWIRRLFCRHDFKLLRNIYGDEINAAGGNRSWWACDKCGKAVLRKELAERGANQ